MRLPPSGTRLARAILVFALALPLHVSPIRALAQSLPDVPLDQAGRDRLNFSSRNPALDEWQRDFMRRLAAHATPAARGAEAPSRAGAIPRLESGPADGVWSRLPPPPSRNQHSAIYDPIRNRMILFGGNAGQNDVWELKLGPNPVWREILPAGEAPPVRYGHTAIFDPGRDRMVVFGGLGFTGLTYSDAWALSLSGPPAWSRIDAVGDSTVLHRFRHSAIYDPIGDRMIVFGGIADQYSFYSVRSDCWALPLSGPPVWTEIVGAPDPVAGPIPGRDQHYAFYDFVRQRMVVYGGRSVTYYYDLLPSDDVWALSLTGDPEWTKLAGSTPPGDSLSTQHSRAWCAAAYDALRDRLVVFSGRVLAPYGYGSMLDRNTWALGLSSLEWTRLDSTGVLPSEREANSAIYDAVGDRVILYGYPAYYGGGYEPDTWSYSESDTAGWTPFVAGGGDLPARYGHSSAYDEVRERVLVFGGASPDSGTLRNDTWALSLIGDPVWTRLDPAGPLPAPRLSHTAVYDRVHDRMVIFGGYGGAYRNDVWALSLAGPPAWTRLFPTGTPPSSRVDHAAAYDPDGDRMFVFGGYSGLFRDDTWQLSLGGTPAWTQLSPSGEWPSPRFSHSAIWDEPRHRMVVFGGQDGLYGLNDVWALSTEGGFAWSRLVDAAPQAGPLRAGAGLDYATAPDPRADHVAIYDSNRQRMVIHGGHSQSSYGYLLNDAWALSLAGASTWTALDPGGEPSPPMDLHVAAYDPHRDLMVVLPGSPGYERHSYILQWSGVVSVEEPGAITDFSLSLSPNPARGAARVSLDLPRESDVEATLLDLAGRRVREIARGRLAAGRHTLEWDGRDALGARVRPGVYFVHVRSASHVLSRRLVVLD